MQFCICTHCISDVPYRCAYWDIYCHAVCVYVDVHTSYLLVFAFSVIVMK